MWIKTSKEGVSINVYSEAFCKVYNEFGWNYLPEAFGEQLLAWLKKNNIEVEQSLDLACGTGILCEILHKKGIEAWGMDFSQGMIEIAQGNNKEIHYEIADMITYCPEKKFDLVTCTGDALNHIIHLSDVEKIFENVYSYLKEGGYFIFDILNENELSVGEAFDLEFSETVKVQFMISLEDGIITLKTTVYENGVFQLEENIHEIVHEPQILCELLEKVGFQVVTCAHQLLEDVEIRGTSWFFIAKK